MATPIPFSKTYSSPCDLVSLLQSRGLTVVDFPKAEHYLMHIGYYRLSAYMYPLLITPKDSHIYKSGATFDKVMMLYRFDKKLRLLIFNEIEKIEIAIRSAIVNITSETTSNPFWMTDALSFTDYSKFNRTISLIDTELRRSREDFIEHFKNTYSDPYPPAWILAEILPFGVITNMYSNIKNKKIKKRISQYFGLQIDPFESWMTIISLTRNACCHHARVWNKQNTIRAAIPHKIFFPWITLPTDVLRIYFNLCIIKYFLDIISPDNDMSAKLHRLFVDFPEIDLSAMGFPKGWEKEPLWK
ncbi:MAG: Abi family protein [Muribaculaceae bacterium]|nr:Abi family protein [Muribaculaceae bacterium]